MGFEWMIAGLVSVGLLVYLTYAMFNADKF
jgi:K+-transporting ATPase KdpF subunit